jgi:hypothetical protein
MGTKTKEPFTRNIFKIIVFFCNVKIVTNFTPCKISQIEIIYIHFVLGLKPYFVMFKDGH